MSAPEADLYRVVCRLLPNEEVIRQARIFLDQRSVDLYIPSLKIAIEFNGLYWHSEKYRDKNYHFTKLKDCENIGIRLIYIWEDDWLFRRSVAIRSIAAKLGAYSRLPEILPDAPEADLSTLYARKGIIKEISNKDANSFMENNHIQGKTQGGRLRNFSLQDSTGLIRAVMQLGPTQANGRRKSVEGRWELIRFATRGHVPGAFSKLFKWSLSSIPEISEVISFADSGVSDGGIYEKHGFILDSYLPPDYKYIVNKRRVPKERYQLKTFQQDPNLLWKDDWTESIAASENGLLRIWDSGKVRYLYSVSPSQP